MADGTNALPELDRLMAELRPALHRYCSRMVGSAFEGEDVLQDVLIKAVEAWPLAGVVERPEGWLFRIAHNTALDALRRRRRRAAAEARADRLDPPAGADSRVAAAASLAALMQLPATQRSCVVLVDVLGHSLEEIIAILGVTAPAAKAALHRGRERLRGLAELVDPPAPRLDPAMRDRLRAYADRFNARDFDALRALLAEDVRLDVVGRAKAAGRMEVGGYFTRYGQNFDWRVRAGVAEGRPAILIAAPADPADFVRWVVLLEWRDGKLQTIRDFRYARYIVEALTITAL
jgi:RNA polymerase sigma-70 factor (ECF subfamily)